MVSVEEETPKISRKLMHAMRHRALGGDLEALGYLQMESWRDGKQLHVPPALRAKLKKWEAVREAANRLIEIGRRSQEWAGIPQRLQEAVDQHRELVRRLSSMK